MNFYRAVSFFGLTPDRSFPDYSAFLRHAKLWFFVPQNFQSAEYSEQIKKPLSFSH
jgi:hypothetical protein